MLKLSLHRQFALFFSLMLLSTIANAAISASETSQSQFGVGGTVEPQCKVRVKVRERSTTLDLTSATRQKTDNIFIWCNTGQNAATATYSSVNNGFMVNENGDKISYLIQIPNTTSSDVSLATPQTVSQRAGTGIDGTDRRRNVRVTPQVTGLETAGQYSDTIQVTVSVN